ncbi:MAG: DNA repair protein RecO [Ignavibacteriales bacterium]|nr:MAG: DNA repair protein RecO [Ignavibacteriales bacterium]
MSQIVKSEAIVLGKMNYRDSSVIVSLYTKDFGKLSLILKGARSPKSKISNIVDPVNFINVVFYKKETRELQFLSSVDLISYYPNIRNSLDGMKYSLAILELIQKLVPEYEQNNRMFNGLTRIFSLLDSYDELPLILFSRFFMFFLTEIGYELQLDSCSICAKDITGTSDVVYNFNQGLICSECAENYPDSFYVKKELFRYLICLKYKKKVSLSDPETGESAIRLMEKFLRYHHQDFKGIQSLKIYN